MAATWKSDQGVRKKKRLTFGDVQTVCRVYLKKRVIELATLDSCIFLKHLDGILLAL
jgi:hypothetical protein